MLFDTLKMDHQYVNSGRNLCLQDTNLLENVLAEARLLPYFWEDFDKQKSQELLLLPTYSDGTFILRKSSVLDANKFLTVSVKKTFQGVKTRVWHFKVTLTQNGQYYLAPSQQKSTLRELIDYHKENPLKGENLPDLCPLEEGVPNTAEFKPNSLTVTEASLGSLSPSNYPKLMNPSSTLSRHPVPSPRIRKKDICEKLEKCDCGIPLKYTQLADGWTVHRSNRKDETKGLLYFRDSQGNSSWQLHPDVDRQCIDRNYLKYGKLNIVNYNSYYVPYEKRSELLRAVSSLSLSSNESFDQPKSS